MDGMLSQDEINALLSGMNSGSGDTSTAEADSASSSDDGFSLSATEKDAVGEISNISMGTAATTLSSLLNQKVNITLLLYRCLIGMISQPCMTGLVS